MQQQQLHALCLQLMRLGMCRVVYDIATDVTYTCALPALASSSVGPACTPTSAVVPSTCPDLRDCAKISASMLLNNWLQSCCSRSS